MAPRGRTLLLAGLAAGAVGVGIAALRRPDRGVRRLEAALDRVRDGDLDVRLHDGPGSGSFNAAVSHIAVMYQALERVVIRQRRFIADASHELRTPLTTVTSSLEMLERFPDMQPERRGRVVTDALAEATRMGRLIQQLIQLARFDAGDSVDRSAFGWRELIDEVSQKMAAAVAPRTLTTTCDGDLGSGVGDRPLLLQLFAELASNVAGHTGEDASVRLHARRTAAGILVEVADTGPGVGSEWQERIVERFVQADPARHGQGSGLGLTLAAAIAAAHRGHLDFAATDPHGLSVRVHLPDAGPDAERRRAPRPRVSRTPGAPA